MIELEIFGNGINRWGASLAVLVGLTGIFWIIRNLLARQISDTREAAVMGIVSIVAEVIRRTKLVVLFLCGLYVAAFLLELPTRVHTIIQTVVFIAVVIQAGIWGSYFIGNGIRRYVGRKVENPATNSGVIVMSLIGRMILWSFILLVILENMGVNVTTLIASLGVGGIAIGLATQNILGDLFASLSILMDRPFEVGHFIIVDDHLGTVERIGLKTTRIRSLSGELLIFGNNDLLQSRVRNFTHFQERRVVFTLGVQYDTPSEKLKKMPQIIRQIIENIDNTRFDRAHFKSFGDFSLVFEVVYYVLSPDYLVYMDIQEKINLGIFAAFQAEGIVFAFPTRTIHIAGRGDENIRTAPAGS
ncbi:MAG: mechanosensitive ion channel family protein [Thermodesulfobacteriota bacterium]|nr:mechanosensitive ion channel family protein [Thermodesulfobacteriota bacterium]